MVKGIHVKIFFYLIKRFEILDMLNQYRCTNLHLEMLFGKSALFSYKKKKIMKVNLYFIRQNFFSKLIHWKIIQHSGLYYFEILKEMTLS